MYKGNGHLESNNSLVYKLSEVHLDEAEHMG